MTRFTAALTKEKSENDRLKRAIFRKTVFITPSFALFRLDVFRCDFKFFLNFAVSRN